MSLLANIPKHYPLVKQLISRLSEDPSTADDLEAHASRLPRTLVGHHLWRSTLLVSASPDVVIVLVAQTQPNEFTALVFESSCVPRLLAYVEAQMPENLDELVFHLGDNTETAIGSLVRHPSIKLLREVKARSAESARDQAAAMMTSEGFEVVRGIRPEVVNELVEMIARAGARQYFSADIDARHVILQRQCAKARLQLTPAESAYLLSL